MPNYRGNNFIFISFDWLWRFFPLRRSTKEEIKWILFSLFPFLFKRWVIYLNWKNARVYHNQQLNIFKREFWNRKIRRSYAIKLQKGERANHDEGDFEKGIAVVIHAFYPDIFKEILTFLSQSKECRLHLYVTGEKNFLDQTDNALLENFDSIRFHQCRNHGRDILPFLKVLPEVFGDGHQIVLKLHTKGSNHLNRKDHWRTDLFSKLIGKDCVCRAIEIFSQNPGIGMIGPSGNILPMHNYYGSNAAIVNELSHKLGVKDGQLVDLNFVAGSMFYARKEALLPVLNLNLSDGNFEKEEGQKDGTLAHAIERLLAVGLIASGLQLADTDYDEKYPVLAVNKNHYFSM